MMIHNFDIAFMHINNIAVFCFIALQSLYFVIVDATQ